MEKIKETVSSGSGTDNGSPLVIDYKALIKGVRDQAEQVEADFGGVLSTTEVAELTGLSVSHIRNVLQALRESGKVRAVRRTTHGAQSWWYSAKDIYELYKESKCLSSG